ncbi:right-handed parallel beta-helix repeat-containing protein [Telluria mixta]|uniref:Right-handed parallel beta-helix repeat-containing protein n=1 Tax=Telluria mixta TaxID=34071 RepID=A0ABT2BYF3_9BURK|nr:right-handed parallel beta-helix repeat-containing protein [Telluria mixta]MCS0630081.1 right-handed parallel beta-helix repeat-containing protein [Telluria mixta]WEM94606.1 right-handed parallel beta-helix repeat-containing protein [Telluria mixta]
MHRSLVIAAAFATAPASAATWYVAPTGSDTAAGSLAAPWQSFAHAQSMAQPGDTVVFRGGRYAFTKATTACASRRATVSAIVLDKGGTEGQPIRYWAYPGETPVFDFSGMKDDCRVKGIEVVADWIHLKGLEITGAPQQPDNRLNHESWGVWIDANHGVFEQLDLHHNMGPGLFIKDGGWNLVLNSDSHHNYDPYTSNGAGQSADGFGAHVSAGHPGNVFRGCRAWANTDDGFDLINAYSPVTIEYSWAWQHGYLPGTHTPLAAGNGNGIKAGGYGGKYVPNGVKHVVRFSVAFDNKVSGFYANHHPIALEFFGNTAFGNVIDYNMLGVAPDGGPVYLGTLRNNLAYPAGTALKVEGADSAANSWDLHLALKPSDFDSVAPTGWDAPRKPDGSLPDVSMFHPSAASAVIDRGVDVGLPWRGKAPDLGAFER